jgi:hypothetical protein
MGVSIAVTAIGGNKYLPAICRGFGHISRNFSGRGNCEAIVGYVAKADANKTGR